MRTTAANHDPSPSRNYAPHSTTETKEAVMAAIKPLLAKILIQVGADEPKEIGTIEIPLEISVPTVDSGKRNITVTIPTMENPAVIAAEVQNRINSHFGI